MGAETQNDSGWLDDQMLRTLCEISTDATSSPSIG